MTTTPQEPGAPDEGPLEPDLPDPEGPPQDPTKPLDQPPGGGTPIEETVNEGN
jgi:hypothetical protein